MQLCQIQVYEFPMLVKEVEGEEKGKGKERQGCKAEFIKVQLSSEIILWLFPSKGSKDERLNIFNLG